MASSTVAGGLYSTTADCRQYPLDGLEPIVANAFRVGILGTLVLQCWRCTFCVVPRLDGHGGSLQVEPAQMAIPVRDCVYSCCFGCRISKRIALALAAADQYVCVLT